MYIVFTCCAACDVINFEINLDFLSKPFSYTIKMPGQKLEYLKNESAFNMKKKTFFVCKELSLKQIKTFFLAGENPTLIFGSFTVFWLLAHKAQKIYFEFF